jgi:hypothetical protein
MEPVSAIAASLALGAAATAGKELVGAVVKDAYAALKRLIGVRYSTVAVDQLERAPESKARRAMVEEDLIAAGAGRDAELLAAAQKLAALIEQDAPATAAAIGVELKDIAAVNLRITGVEATGTAVIVERAALAGDIDIHNVKAGGPAKRPATQG